MSGSIHCRAKVRGTQRDSTKRTRMQASRPRHGFDRRQRALRWRGAVVPAARASRSLPRKKTGVCRRPMDSGRARMASPACSGEGVALCSFMWQDTQASSVLTIFVGLI